MSRLGLGGRVLIAVAVVAAVFAAVLAMLVWSVLDFRSAADSTAVSDDSIARANTVEKLVLDLETGLRGYVISGNEVFLEPLEAARVDLPGVARDLSRLEGDDEDQASTRRIAALALAYLREFATPVVTLARRDPRAAQQLVSTGAGKQRTDEIRAAIDTFVRKERVEADERRAAADRRGTLSMAAGVAGLVLTLLLAAGLYAYLRRAVLRPVDELAGATRRLAAGDFAARVADGGRADALGRLGGAFNTMADALEDTRDELETQNAELEAQQGELERTVEQLQHERDIVLGLNRFVARLAEGVEVESVALAVLEDLSAAGRADVGAVYAAGVDEDAETLRLVTSRGIHPDRLDVAVLEGDGLAGRAVAERAPALASYGDTALTLAAWGEEVTVRHELHLPLVHGQRVLGVVSLARAGDPAFTPDDLAVLESMARQSAVALSNALALRAARHDAGVTRAVLDATPDGICLTDAAGDVLLANAPMLELSQAIGFAPEGTVYDRLLSAADRMTDPDAYRAGMAEIAATPDGQFRQEYTVQDSGRSFLGYVAPVRDWIGSVGGRVFVLRETTAERQAERLKDELVATVSHELRTPLTSIIGYLEIVLGEEDGALAPSQHRFLQVVDRNARRLLDVVGDLLFVAQVEAGRLALDLERLDLTPLVGDMAESARPAAASGSVDLNVDAEPGLLVLGDRVRLGQLLANLVSNAVKFTPAGGRVDVTARRRGGSVVVEVADTGIGIPEDEQEKMFQRFFRSSTASQHAIQGTGLGLVIAKAIVEAHEGSISFTSTPGVGTTFTVDLPVAVPAGQEVQVA
jgi:signal transduction histidine kinase/CHASE3 domain sensor protein